MGWNVVKQDFPENMFSCIRPEDIEDVLGKHARF